MSRAFLRLGPPRAALVVAATLLAVLAAAACGGGSGGASGGGFQKVTATDQALSIDDFLTAGFKQSKEYDVTGLPGAVSAYYGFWNHGGDSIEYELRFYPTHEAAVGDGTSLADEVTGHGAAVTEAESTWKQGVRDRRTSGFTIGGGGGNLGVKHADYAIYGNVVMLCQGRDSIQSLARCEALISGVNSG